MGINENSQISLNGEYKITKKIAEGGMGAVFLANKHGVEGFEKTVALKMMLNKFSDNKESLTNFIAEAKLVANLIHENIVQIYQFSKCDDGYYFELEYVDGVSLHQLIDINNLLKRKVPRMLAVFIASRVARGLAYAHARKNENGNLLGIVHCDICPRNILINSEGVPKITDFGIARVGTTNENNKISGKFSFMAPEQARGENVDLRADIYALGLVLYLLLTGVNPRGTITYETNSDKSDISEILNKISANNLDWSSLPNDLEPELKVMLEKMLANSPEERYSSTAELAHDMEYFIYKDGYGPTIVTLSDYLKELMPGRFMEKEIVIEDVDKTLVLK